MLGPPRLMLITFALFLTPKFRAAISLALVHRPTVLQARSAMSFAFQQTPVVPRPLFPTAPIVPETCVPWPLRSRGSLPPLPTKSEPRLGYAASVELHRFAAR